MKVHVCTVCRNLPIRPFDPADREPGREYRPDRPRPTVAGGPRSRVCRTHDRAKTKAAKARTRAKRRETVFGVPSAVQLLLWIFQGSACPCGRKRAPEPPPGVHLDHDHDLARLHDHPEDEGCLDCVTGFLCQQCNREIVGRLSRHWSRDRVAGALFAVARHLTDPPLRRLLSERPDLKDIAA